MYMSHTIRMIDVLYTPDATRSRSLHMPRINHCKNNVYDASSNLTLNRFMMLRTPEITSVKPRFSPYNSPDKISIERGERERQIFKISHANDEILWSVMTWIPHPKESSDMSTQPKCDYDLNGTHKNQVRYTRLSYPSGLVIFLLPIKVRSD